MSVLLFLNELSCATTAPRRRVDQAMVEFVELLRMIRRLRGDVVLVTHISLKSIELAQGYYMQQWIAADAANRDRWRFILDAVWENSWITADLLFLEENNSGDLVDREELVEVRHAATCDHAVSHKTWVQEAGRDGLTSVVTIWENKGYFFPHLTFLPRVEDDLRNLRQDCVRPVVDQLVKLEQAVAEWPDGHEATQWKTKVTGEYEMRRKLCELPDLDGVVRVFELPARFTPGAGRLHFRLVPEDRTARAAYIGRKIGI